MSRVEKELFSLPKIEELGEIKPDPKMKEFFDNYIKRRKEPFEKVVSELQDAVSLIEHVRDKKQQADSNALITFAANIQRIECMLNEAIKTLDKI